MAEMANINIKILPKLRNTKIGSNNQTTSIFLERKCKQWQKKKAPIIPSILHHRKRN